MSNTKLCSPKEEQPILPAAASMPRRRSLRLHPQLCVEAGASTKPTDIELFFLSGNCPRCGRVSVDSFSYVNWLFCISRAAH